MPGDLEFNPKNFFSDLIFHPEHALTKKDRDNAWKATLLLGIFTLGMAHLGAAIYQVGCYIYDQCVVTEVTQENLDKEDSKAQTVAKEKGVVPNSKNVAVDKKDNEKVEGPKRFSPDLNLQSIPDVSDLTAEERNELNTFTEGMKKFEADVSYVYVDVPFINKNDGKELPAGWYAQSFVSYATKKSKTPDATSLQKNAEKGLDDRYLFALSFANVHDSVFMMEPPIKMPDPLPDGHRGEETTYPAVEFYFQYCKRVLNAEGIQDENEKNARCEQFRMDITHPDFNDEDRIRDNPGDAYTVGYYYRNAKGENANLTLNKNDIARWDQISKDVMKGALFAKFTQHPLLREELKATHPYQLCQLKTNKLWGPGEDGKGKNLLGVCLMEVREAIIKGEIIPPYAF